jgi:hypothetical protein
LVVRQQCKCSTCGQAHTLRISVGYNLYQEHTFCCVGCNEAIVVGMKVNLQDMSFPLEYISNCHPGTEEGQVINLHPHFTIPEDQLHKDKAFPWLVDNLKVHQVQMAISSERPEFSSLEEKLEYIRSIQSRPVGWKIISKAWSLIQNERDDLAQNYLIQYKDSTFDGPQELNHILFHFCWDLTKPKNWVMYLGANILAAEISHKFLPQYHRFKDYYLTNLCREHLHRYFDIFSEYFQCYSEFNQTFMFAQYGLPLPEESQASSRGFKRTKMFYGNAFEVLTSNFTVLACLNNILSGRRYDTFSTMDLSKYLTIDKASRGNPFKDTQPFFEFSRDLDSVLRNASHHGAMKIDRTNKIISYRSGGTGAIHTIPYSAYLYKCNEIFLKVAALLLLELTISSS